MTALAPRRLNQWLVAVPVAIGDLEPRLRSWWPARVTGEAWRIDLDTSREHHGALGWVRVDDEFGYCSFLNPERMNLTTDSVAAIARFMRGVERRHQTARRAAAAVDPACDPRLDP
jgi:hypothetical protein